MSWNILRQNQPLLGVIIAGGLTVLSSTAPVWGQNESDKVTASDGAAGDRFGSNVSIDGDTAIVGARQHDHNGANSGSAYIYEQDSVDPSLWNEVVELLAGDGEAGDHFGNSVAISGNVAVVGAIFDNHGGLTDAGSAYIFRFSGGSWSQEAKLTASDAASDDWFGNAVAIDGNVVVIGAKRDDHSSLTNPGSVYIFRFSSGGSWSEEDKITATSPANHDEFGFAVAVLGDIALIGVPFDDDAGASSGSAYVFKHAAGDWTQEQKLTASDALLNDHFGWSVALETDVAVVGAAFGGITYNNSGSAYVFTFDGDDWNEDAEIEASVSTFGFGTNLAISDDTIISGTPNHNHSGLTNPGSAWVFHFDGTNWVEEARLTASDAASGDRLGHGVGLSGGIAFVGAGKDDDNGTDSGSGYVFDPVCPCPWDLNADGMVSAADLLALLADWGNPYGAADLLDLLAAWGVCPCVEGTPPLPLQEELDDACLSSANWADFLDKMETGSSAERQNYICWLTHYFEDCTRCICIGASGCPGPDPFD